MVPDAAIRKAIESQLTNPICVRIAAHTNSGVAEMKMRNSDKRITRRRLAPKGAYSDQHIVNMIEYVKYSGNPVHKKHPGNFALNPPANHRPGKTLCDISGIFRIADALDLLRRGLEFGTISMPGKDGWPRRIWAVGEGEMQLEAQPDAIGSYHGYPLLSKDPFHSEVINIWKEKNDRFPH